jgi:hypothetical protein
VQVATPEVSVVVDVVQLVAPPLPLTLQMIEPVGVTPPPVTVEV